MPILVIWASAMESLRIHGASADSMGERRGFSRARAAVTTQDERSVFVSAWVGKSCRGRRVLTGLPHAEAQTQPARSIGGNDLHAACLPAESDTRTR